jgi:HAD superfamily hydrolase (TIGR01509 family)
MSGQDNTKVRAVVFDMDGVLIDSHPVHRAAWTEFLNMRGCNVSDNEFNFILEGHTRSEILRHFFGVLSDSDLLAYGKQKDEIFRALEREIAPVPGVLSFIEKLRQGDVAIAIATSASEIRTSSTIERLGLGGRFEAVITASDVETGKPDPAVYRLACERISIPPGEAVAFDDAPAGIQAALSASMRCIGIASNGIAARLFEAGAEQVIPNFTGFDVNRLAGRPLTSDIYVDL